ncbi:MAG: hypothetical protein IPK53_03590 [bacterium]|nr:hypothetical protein [bacterium]
MYELPVPNVSLVIPFSLVWFFIGTMVLGTVLQVLVWRGKPEYGWKLTVVFSAVAALFMYDLLLILSGPA